MRLEGESLQELESLTGLRNELAHHGGFYRFAIFAATGEIFAETKAMPEVPNEAARKAIVIVTEVCDAIYGAMCRKLFGSEPAVRPLTPEVAAVHKSFRRQWEMSRSANPKIEECAGLGWIVRESRDSDFIWISDVSDGFMIVPTGIEAVPALISFRRNNRHGTKARITVDDNPCQELGDSAAILEQMLEGTMLLVEFNEEPWDTPRYARFSLDGFAEVWHAAWRSKVDFNSG